MKVQRKKCFVLMSFATQYLEVYSNVYKPVCDALEIDCWRVDEISRPGSITKDIIEGIVEADILIADLTSKNPNVFYELGIAHSVGNKTIMTAQDIADVPFDIANYRVILYKQTITGAEELSQRLTSAISELLTALDRTNNPAQEVFSGRTKLGQRRREPLVKYVDINNIPHGMRNWLQEHGVYYADDVNNIDLEELINTPGVGKTSLGKFFAQVLEHDLFDDVAKLQGAIMKYGIRLRGPYY